MIDTRNVEYELKDTQLRFKYQCDECGIISNSVTLPHDASIQGIMRSYIIDHSRLHEMAVTGELTKKFITMVKGV